jgi:hypothetical protein
MSPNIEMRPLSQRKRRFVFLLAVTLFLIAVPFSVFYAIGYRFDLNEISNIKSVGGMYVRNDTENTEMFINDEPVRDMRVFQKAAYIQNLEAGMHRLHVQGDGVQTWVKELPVYAHFVTEVSSFTVPKVPQIRIITPYSNPIDGRGVLFEEATSTTFDFASTTNALIFSSTTATSSLTVNPEYAYVQSLIASSTEMNSLLSTLQQNARGNQFTFGETSATSSRLFATTTSQWREFSLFKKGDEVHIAWDGEAEDIPYYYCVLYSGKKKTSLEYGEHVYEALLEQYSAQELEDKQGERLCRTEIRIDRKEQEVRWFGFFPNSADLVLMQLQDGLYVVEVDDRAWQNTQLLYPGEDFIVVQDGGRIYIQDGEYYLEVFTDIASQT